MDELISEVIKPAKYLWLFVLLSIAGMVYNLVNYEIFNNLANMGYGSIFALFCFFFVMLARSKVIDYQDNKIDKMIKNNFRKSHE